MNSTVDFFKQHFEQKKVAVQMIIGHCSKGRYLVVPKAIFGTDTIFLQKDQFEFQLDRVLERILEKSVITQEMIDEFENYNFIHLLGHSGNGNHVIKLHQMILDVTVDKLNDWALERYNDVVSYILLKQSVHNAKMYLRWINSVPEDNRRMYFGISAAERVESIRQNYEMCRDALIKARKLAKENCGSQELFDVMVRHYWKEQNAKSGL